jgi:phospholipase/carboxylesterase
MTAPDPHKDQPILRLGPTLDQAQAAVILLHGRGASAQDILGLALEFDLPHIAWLAPEAANHTWYPNSFLVPTRENEPWLTSALAKVQSTIDQLLAGGLPLNKIALCGFSQGACLSTEFVARNPARYAALIALTGGLIGTDQEASGPRTGSLEGTPAFLASGDPDPHVPWKRVERSAEVLTTLGANVTTHRYPNRPHTVTRDEITRARQLLAAI